APLHGRTHTQSPAPLPGLVPCSPVLPGAALSPRTPVLDNPHAQSLVPLPAPLVTRVQTDEKPGPRAPLPGRTHAQSPAPLPGPALRSPVLPGAAPGQRTPLLANPLALSPALLLTLLAALSLAG